MARDILEELVTKFTYDVDQAGLNKYEQAQKKINKNTKDMIGLNTTLGKVMRRIFVGAGAVIGVRSMVTTYRSLDLIRRSIEGLTQSTQDWEYIQREAFRTATDIETVAAGYRNFYSAATMAGMDKDSVQTMYSGILEAGRAVGATQPQIKGALLALEQMFSKGKVSMEELRRQLGNALPGAFEVAAKAMGVTTQEFNELIKKGVQATELVPKFTEEYRKTFAKSFPEAMKSLDAAMVNLSTSWKLFQYDLMNSGAGKELAKFFVEISKFLQSDEAKSFAKAIGVALQGVAKALQFLVKHFRMILFLFGVATLMQAVTSLSALRYRILDIATTMNNGLSPAMDNIVGQLANMIFYGGGFKNVIGAIGKALVPFGKWALIIAAVAAALYGIYLLLEDIFTYINHPEWESFTKDLVEQFPIINDMIEDMKKAFSEMQPVFKDLAKVGGELIAGLLRIIKEIAPALTTVIKAQIALLTGLLWLLTQIVKLINFILDPNKTIIKPKPIPNFNDMPRQKEGEEWFISAYKPTMGQRIKGMFAPKIPQFSDRYYGGMDLTKTENDTKNITNNVTINATNHSIGQISDMVNNIINGTLDNLNATVNQTPQAVPSN